MFTAMRRTLAMLLAAMMLLTAMPFATIAEEIFDDVVIAVQDFEEETAIEELSASEEIEEDSEVQELVIDNFDSAMEISLDDNEIEDEIGMSELPTMMTSEDFVLSEYGDDYILEQYTGNDKNVVIPSGVLWIWSDAFSNNTTIESVTIPEGVKYISNSAFSDCTNLKKVVLPESLKSIGKHSFNWCESLEELWIPKNTELDIEDNGHGWPFWQESGILTLYVYDGSPAHEACKKYPGYTKFVVIDDTEQIVLAMNKTSVDPGYADSVKFTISSDRAEKVRILADGNYIGDEHALVNGVVSFNQSFHVSGTRKIQVEGYYNGKWALKSTPQTLTVSYLSALGTPEFTSITGNTDTAVQNQAYTLKWAALKDAVEYCVYVYDGDTQVYKEVVGSGTQVTIPASVFTTLGQYVVEVIGMADRGQQSNPAAHAYIQVVESTQNCNHDDVYVDYRITGYNKYDEAPKFHEVATEYSKICHDCAYVLKRWTEYTTEDHRFNSNDKCTVCGFEKYQVGKLYITGKDVLIVGESTTLTVYDSNGKKVSNKALTWKCDWDWYAKINSSGKVTAKKSGPVTITATDKNGVSGEIWIWILDKATGVTLKFKDGEEINKKTTYTVDKDKTPTIILSVLVHPDTGDSRHRSISWKSSNTKIATVSNKGVVTLLSDGNVQITATTKDGTNKKATLKLKVTDPYKPTSIALNDSGTIKVNKGETVTLGYTLKPEAAKADLSWKTSNKKIATVENGMVTGKKEGTVTITVKTHNGKQDTVKVKVVDPYKPTSIVLDDNKTITLSKGEVKVLGYSLKPNTATATLKWRSSNKKIVAVSNGVVTGVKAGNATITVTTHNGKKDTIKIKVVDSAKPKSISLKAGKKITITQGQKYSLGYELTPVTAETKLTWKSDKTSIVSVDKYGTITGKKKGTANITVTTSNKLTAKIKVTVTNATVTVAQPEVSFKDYQAGKVHILDLANIKDNGAFSIAWEGKNANSYTYKAILMNSRPVGSSNESSGATELDFGSKENTTSISIPKSKLAVGKFVKVAIQAHNADGLDSSYPWVGFEIVDSSVVDMYGTPWVQETGTEGDMYTVAVTVPKKATHVAIAYVDGGVVTEAKAFAKSDVTIKTASDNNSILNAQYDKWVFGYPFSAGDASNGYKRTTLLRASFDNKNTWSNVKESSAFVVKPKEANNESRIQEAIQRAEAVMNITWSPKKTITAWEGKNGYNSSYAAGKNYSGFPYGQVANKTKAQFDQMWESAIKKYSDTLTYKNFQGGTMLLYNGKSFESAKNSFLNAIGDAEHRIYDNDYYTCHNSSPKQVRQSPLLGTDCSAFVSYMIGSKKTYTTSGFIDQANKYEKNPKGGYICRYVSRDEIKRGDLICAAGNHVVFVAEVKNNGKVLVYEQNATQRQVTINGKQYTTNTYKCERNLNSEYDSTFKILRINWENIK